MAWLAAQKASDGDRKEVAAATLEVVAPLLPHESQGLVVSALADPDGAWETLEVLRLNQSYHQRSIRIDEEGIEIGDSWVPIQD